MKLKVKRTARKTITKIVPKPLVIELIPNREEAEEAGSGANSDFSENVSESSPSEKAKDVNISPTTSGSNFSWKKEFVKYEEETSDSGQSDSMKPRFLRAGPTVKDDAVTVSSGSLFSEGDDLELDKETMVQAEEPHVESSASNASCVSIPHEITSDNSSSKSDDFELNKEITVPAEESHVEQLQKTGNLRKLTESKGEKRASTSIQEVPTVSKRGRGRPPKEGKSASIQEVPTVSKRGRGRPPKEGKSTSIQEVPESCKRGRGRPPKEGKSASIQKVPESCKRGRGRPRKQSVVDEVLPSSESANFAPLEKNVSIVLKRLTNAALKKYNVEDQLKISVVSDTEIQNANLKKENIQKWLQTVVIVH